MCGSGPTCEHQSRPNTMHLVDINRPKPAAFGAVAPENLLHLTVHDLRWHLLGHFQNVSIGEASTVTKPTCARGNPANKDGRTTITAFCHTSLAIHGAGSRGECQVSIRDEAVSDRWRAHDFADRSFLWQDVVISSTAASARSCGRLGASRIIRCRLPAGPCRRTAI